MADFAATIRQDDGGVYEGVTSFAIDFKRFLFTKSWLQPGITYNDIYVTRNGQYLVKIPSKYGADVTNLCDPSAATGKTGDAMEAVIIDKKTSTFIDSCFISKGINDDEINNFNVEVEIAAESIREKLEAVTLLHILTFGTQKTSTSTTEIGKLTEAKAAYKKANNVSPNVVLISPEYEAKLQNEILAGNLVLTQTGQSTLVNGSIGTLNGMTFVPVTTDDDFDFIMYNYQLLALPIAKDAKSNVTELTNSNRGIQLIEEVDGPSGTFKTWLHLNFGQKLLKQDGFLVYNYTPGGVQTQKATTNTTKK